MKFFVKKLFSLNKLLLKAEGKKSFTDQINTILTARIFHVQLRIISKMNSSFPTRSASFILRSDRQKERKFYTNRERKEIFRFAFRDSLWCLKIAMRFARRETRWQCLMLEFLVSFNDFSLRGILSAMLRVKSGERSKMNRKERKISFEWLIRAIRLITFVRFQGKKKGNLSNYPTN